MKKKLILDKETIQELDRRTMQNIQGADGDITNQNAELWQSQALCLTVKKWERDCGGSQSCIFLSICIEF